MFLENCQRCPLGWGINSYLFARLKLIIFILIIDRRMSQKIKDIIQSQIKAAFSLFDAEGKGTIEFKDFGTLMRSIGYDIDQEMALFMAEKLTQKTGESFISYSDFKSFYYTALNSGEMREDLKKAFEAIDMDKDKLISFSDLRGFLDGAEEKRSEEEISEMIKEADIDGDGLISFEEFLRLMATR